MKIQGRYEYDPQKDLLGKGGFARVFRATDTLLHRDVALKVFSNTGSHQYSVLAEIRKVIGLEHPNLLRYYDVVLLEGKNQLDEIEQTQIGVMELANAGDLKDFARANPGSPLLYKFLKEVLLGLEYLHSQGIIHRDLKAQNILLVKGKDDQLTAKISDFGISKDTGSGGQSSSMMVGTIEYMAPEQFSPAKYGIDGKVSSNLDMWSFGIMVHELLTDTTPFGSRDGDTTAEQIMSQILSTEMPDGIDRLPEPYKSVVRKCLVANAKERIRKASELLSYFEGTGNTAKDSAGDDSTRVYPRGGPDAQTGTQISEQKSSADPDATKMYLKAGAVGAKTAVAEDDATMVYPKAAVSRGNRSQEATTKKMSKTMMVAAAGAVLLASAGFGVNRWIESSKQKEAVQKAQVQQAEEAVQITAKAEQVKLSEERERQRFAQEKEKQRLADEIRLADAREMANKAAEKNQQVQKVAQDAAKNTRSLAKNEPIDPSSSDVVEITSVSCQELPSPYYGAKAYRVQAKGFVRTSASHQIRVVFKPRQSDSYAPLKNEDPNCGGIWIQDSISCERRPGQAESYSFSYGGEVNTGRLGWQESVFAVRASLGRWPNFKDIVKNVTCE